MFSLLANLHGGIPLSLLYSTTAAVLSFISNWFEVEENPQKRTQQKTPITCIGKKEKKKNQPKLNCSAANNKGTNFNYSL